MMACNCHGKNGESVRFAKPLDQCTTCAKKHIVKAWNLFNEFTYTDDNRDVISGQLRNAVDHLMYDNKEIALLARDLAVLIEENKDEEIQDKWDILLKKIRFAFYCDHLDAKERLIALQKQHNPEEK